MYLRHIYTPFLTETLTYIPIPHSPLPQAAAGCRFTASCARAARPMTQLGGGRSRDGDPCRLGSGRHSGPSSRRQRSVLLLCPNLNTEN
jgi:hypothetical protein